MKALQAFVMMVLVGTFFIAPFVLIGYGVWCAVAGNLLRALLCVAGGLLWLWLVKPISIITGHDFDIF